MTDEKSEAPGNAEGPTTPALIVPTTPDATTDKQLEDSLDDMEAMFDAGHVDIAIQMAGECVKDRPGWRALIEKRIGPLLKRDDVTYAQSEAFLRALEPNAAVLGRLPQGERDRYMESLKLEPEPERVAVPASSSPTLAVPFSTMMLEPHVEPPELVAGLIPEGGLVLLAASPGAGKTWAAAALAVSVSSGAAFMGAYHVTKPGRVLLVANEGGAWGLRARLESIARGYGIDPATLDRLDVIVGKSHLAQIDDVLDGDLSSYQLVIFDTVAASCSIDENDNRAVSDLVRRLRRTTDTGCTITLVHHLNKGTEANRDASPGQRVRGASAWHGARDSLLVLTRSGTETRVRVDVELRDGEPQAFTFDLPEQRVDGSAPVLLNHQPVRQSIAPADTLADRIIGVIRESEPVSRNELAKLIGGRRATVLAEVSSLLASGRITEAPNGLGITRNQSGTSPVPASA
jgi:hypothetical protein